MNRPTDLHRLITVDIKANLANILLLAVYLIIAIPILFFMNRDPNRTHWSYVAVYLAFYTIIAILIWINRQNLDDFHIDRLSVILFLLFGTLFRTGGVDKVITIALELALYPIAITLGIKLWKGKVPLRAMHKKDWLWIGIAILSGFALTFIVIMFHPRRVYPFTQVVDTGYLVGGFLGFFLTEIGKTGILEEPLYRGFLWGTLKKMGFREGQVLVLQAFFFWITHLNALWDAPYTFWVSLPIFSLLLGFLAWKSKSIVPPLIAHVIYNALSLVA